MNFLIFSGIAYLLGSIPTAVWIGKSWYNIDVREHGSKNAGATNTFRVLGKKPGIIVLSIDVLKGFFAVYIPVFFIQYSVNDELVKLQIIAAILVVLGHVFPLFANFKGGKGVATSLGVVFGIHPPAATVCLLVFLLVFIICNYVSLGAIVAAIIFPFVLKFVFAVESIWLLLFSVVLSLAVIITHRKNVTRLLHGQENKMNLFKK
ncbi:MAG: glycerol-3-phosphate 1-O-acyltransferase PlsY [Flavobacteriia bacterium]|nr:glycerol-3-phosphate 1-O-acyltransferase PlsY [Flavobacteriia bacterium]